MQHGEIIPAVQGRIKKVFDQKRSEPGAPNQWVLQNFVLQDDNEEIYVTWGGDDDLSTIEGRLVSLECSETKHGLTGVKRDITTKRGKTYEGIKLTGSCKIRVIEEAVARYGPRTEVLDPENIPPTGGGDSRVQSGKDSQIGRDDEAASSPPPTKWGIPDKTAVLAGGWIGMESQLTPNDPDQQQLDNILKARKHLMQAANLYNLCVQCVDSAIAPTLPPIARTSEQFQATLASIWIEASSRRSEDGIKWFSYIDMMPTKPIQK
jgi:hypothetical protein